MDKLLFASMMCANYDNLKNEVINLDDAGIDYFHCDIMDGEFVPNMTMGIQDIQSIRRNTDKKIDLHLMIENPGSKLDLFLNLGANLIIIHAESERYLSRTLSRIKSEGILTGLAINPDTSIEQFKEVLYLCDYVLVMTVNPGFAGQSFINNVLNKIKILVEMKRYNEFKIIIDGATTLEKIKSLSKVGVDGFVLGTSSLFNKNDSYKAIIKDIRSL